MSEAVGGLRVIDRFRGEYFFLSNCCPAATPHRGRLFPTSEHAYMTIAKYANLAQFSTGI